MELRRKPVQLCSRKDRMGTQRRKDRVNETKFGSAALILRLQWVSHRAGWRLFVASVPTRPSAVRPTSVKTKQKKGDTGSHHFTPPSLPSLQYPAFILHPISSQLKASFVFHLLPRPGLVYLRWLSDVLERIFLVSYYILLFLVLLLLMSSAELPFQNRSSLRLKCQRSTNIKSPTHISCPLPLLSILLS